MLLFAREQAAGAGALATKAAAARGKLDKILHGVPTKLLLGRVALLVVKVVRRARLVQVLTVLQRVVAEAARALGAQVAAPAARVARLH
jgi:hypothetical protein